MPVDRVIPPSSTLPSVSVVLPVRNRAHSIEKSLRSVLEQTVAVKEVLVVDDGSTDNTCAVIENIGADRVQLIRHGVTRGANAARNTGIRAASGDYIAFQDSDDCWLPQKLERQLAAITGHGAQVVFTSLAKHHAKGVRVVPKASYRLPEGLQHIHSRLLRGSFIGTPTLIVDRETLAASGLFDEQLPRLQDWDLCLRMARLAPFYFISEPLVDVYNGPHRISSRPDLYVSALDIIVHKHAQAFAADGGALATVRLNAALSLAQDGEYHLARTQALKAIYQGPRDLLDAMTTLWRRR